MSELELFSACEVMYTADTWWIKIQSVERFCSLLGSE